FRQTTTGTYREIAKGWMDLTNPSAGYDSYTAARADRIIAMENIGVFHDYTLYLQPTVHTAKAGNRLALIITTGGTNAAAYTDADAFTFTIDNAATYAYIPKEAGELSIDGRLSIKAAKRPLPGEDFAPAFKLEAVEDVSVNLIVAAYDGKGRLTDASVSNKALSAGEKAQLQASIPYREGLTYKFYIWDASQTPLAKSTAF
ncbi:MAG: hypothetical protein LBG71_03560, partial [Clostridiales Family XIII bacterium]|nr:hypothetical protein [Clostridiales Family XIII bacterium]